MRKRILQALLLAAFMGAASQAQAAWHLYLVPAVTVSDGVDPKYLVGQFSCKTYGRQPVYLCAADTTATLDATIQAAADAFKLPDNLDQNLSAQAVGIVQTALENRNLPSQWVDTLHTYRDVIRIINGMFNLLGHYISVSGSNQIVFGGAVTLNTTMNQLPNKVRSDLRTSATELGLNISSIAGNTPLREALQIVGEQFLNTSFVLGGIVI